MICPNCKKQIPDDSNECFYCGVKINHKEQVSREISSRRYQRWFFYTLIVFIFLGMIGIIIKIYNANNKLITNLTTMEITVKNSKTEINQTKQELDEKNKKLKQTEEELSAKDKELQTKVDKLKKEMSDAILSSEAKLKEKNQKNSECKIELSKADSNIYSLVINLGTGVSTADLNKIPLADANLKGVDNDQDGLSNEIEEALGTNINSKDSDNDGYTDKNELLKGFNPLGDGIFKKDDEFIKKYSGRILLQVESNNEAWYVSKNGKKYFLGNPMNGFKAMRSVDYWTKTLPQGNSTVLSE